MRLCAKLLIELKRIKKLDTGTFAELLVPENFNDIVTAVLKVSVLNDQNTMTAPSNAIKMGHDLKRLIDLKIVFCGIMENNESARKEAEDLLKMMKVLWGPKVTKAARVLLDQRRFQKSSPLPTAEDIQKLNEHLKTELQNLDLLKTNYDNFVRVAISRIVSYNRRRTGEVEAVRVEDYHRRTKGMVNDIAELTSFEKTLLETQDVMEVRGKTGRGVPILIPSDVQKAMDYLASADTRQKCGIKGPYMFARKGGGTVRAYDALQKTSNSAGIEEPSRVTSTQMRKYMATITQVLDLKDNQMSWVLNHLGHTLNVHKIHYRATSDVIERTQVAKILLMQDHSRIKEFANKRLEDIQLNDLVHQDTPFGVQVQEDAISDVQAQSEKFEFEAENSDDGLEFETKKARAHLTRKAWTKDEEDEIRSEFKTCFDTLKRPSVNDVEKCIRKSRKKGTNLHLRSKSTLKKKIFRMINSARKSNN